MKQVDLILYSTLQPSRYAAISTTDKNESSKHKHYDNYTTSNLDYVDSVLDQTNFNYNNNSTDRDTNIRCGSVISRLEQTLTTKTMSQTTSTVGHSPCRNLSVDASASCTTRKCACRQCSSGKIEETNEDFNQSRTGDKNMNENSSIEGLRYVNSSIEGLSEKVKEFILNFKKHPAAMFKEEFLWEKLEEEVYKGNVKRFSSDDNRFQGYHYTQQPVKNPKLWNIFNMMARPLVFEVDPLYYKFDTTGMRFCTEALPELVALPHPKFFNLNEDVELDYIKKWSNPSQWEITSKMDGSLGIIFHDEENNQWICCTKGSFNSPQAKFANHCLTQMDTSVLFPGHTYLVEIILANSKGHILKYLSDELVLFGGYNNRKGKEYTYKQLHDIVERQERLEKYRYIGQRQPNKTLKIVPLVPFPKQTTNFDEMEKYLNDPDIPLMEGFVFKYDTGKGSHRFKWKSNRYFRAVKAQHEVPKESIFKAFKKSNEDVKELRDTISPIFHSYFDNTIVDFNNQIFKLLNRITNQLNWIVEKSLPGQKGFQMLQEHFASDDGDRWYDGVKLDQGEKKLIFKAYSDGMDAFKINWLQNKKCTRLNKDRQILLTRINVV